MNSVRNTHRLGWLAMSVLAGFSFAQSVCAAHQQRDDTPPAVSTNAPKSSLAKAELLANRLTASNFTLAKAVKVAEEHCKGTALAAAGRCTGESANADAVIDVTVMDSDRTVRLVTVGMDGRVIGMRDGASGSTAGSPGVNPIVKADEVIGREVVSPTGENLGKIEDLAIDPTSGRVGYAVLSFGGWLGIKDKHFAIPWPKLQPQGADKYVLDASKEQLKNAPGFSSSAWPDMNDIKWNETIHTFYQQPYYWNEDRNGVSMSDRRPSIYRGTEVIGIKVINKQNESIGEIQDLVLDPQSGKMRYAVVSVGGFLGIKERYIAVPWSAFHYDTNAKKLVLDVDKQRIEQAPGFDKKNWPTFADEDWATSLHKYYNVEPYWNKD